MHRGRASYQRRVGSIRGAGMFPHSRNRILLERWNCETEKSGSLLSTRYYHRCPGRRRPGRTARTSRSKHLQHRHGSDHLNQRLNRPQKLVCEKHQHLYRCHARHSINYRRHNLPIESQHLEFQRRFSLRLPACAGSLLPYRRSRRGQLRTCTTGRRHPLRIPRIRISRRPA